MLIKVEAGGNKFLSIVVSRQCGPKLLSSSPVTSFTLSSVIRKSFEAVILLLQTGGERTHGIFGVNPPDKYSSNPYSIEKAEHI
jgi:hypothetical protein